MVYVNPKTAHRALVVEKQIGLFLPCNIIVYVDLGKTYVATILPSVAMGVINNKELDVIAKDVEAKLITIIENLI